MGHAGIVVLRRSSWRFSALFSEAAERRFQQRSGWMLRDPTTKLSWK
jgi:hypothetical protein